jgi:hypothetical protein
MKTETDPFAYLVFDGDSGELLSHGANPFTASQEADELAPTKPIQVIFAGPKGPPIWREKLGMAVALQIVKSGGGAVLAAE